MVERRRFLAGSILSGLLAAVAGCGEEKGANSKVLGGPTEEQKAEQQKMEEFMKSKQGKKSR